jgi:hypothetical protein
MGNKFSRDDSKVSFFQAFFCLRLENNKFLTNNWLKCMRARCLQISNTCEWTVFVLKILKEARNFDNHSSLSEISELTKERKSKRINGKKNQ